MKSSSRQPRVLRRPVSDELRRLETYVGRMERRYECSSASAEAAVERGDIKETAEVNRWLTSYRVLTKLSEATAAG